MKYVGFALSVVLLAFSIVFGEGNTPVNTTPDPTSASFTTEGPEFWRQEMADYMKRYLPLPDGRVYSGGVHGLSGSCVSPSFSVEAITSNSNRVLATEGGGSVQINYGAGNISGDCNSGHTDTCWVVASPAAVATLPTTNFKRSGSSNIYVDCTSTERPNTPADAAMLMEVTLTSGAITAVTNLGTPATPEAGWTESYAVGVRTDNTGPTLFFVNTDTGFNVDLYPPGVWHTFNVTDFGIPIDVKNIFAAGILIITHGNAVETCDLTVSVRAKGDTLDAGNYIFQTVEPAYYVSGAGTQVLGGGQRSTASSYIPVRNGQYELQWNYTPVDAGDWPDHCSFGINLHAQQYTRFQPVIKVGTTIAEPTPLLDSYYVASFATGGDGTVGTPWTGWDTALTWNVANRSFYFQPGYYSLTDCISTISASRVKIKGTGDGLAIINFAPTADKSCGVFTFSNGASANVQSGMENISIRSADSTHTKIGVKLSDVQQFTMHNVSIGTDGGWTGNLSEGLEINGATNSIFTLEANGDIPIRIRDNPNSANDLDNVTFRDILGVGTAADGNYSGNREPVVLIDTGINISNWTWEGFNRLKKNSDGIRWIDTTSATTSTNLCFRNVDWRDGTYASGYILRIEHNTGIETLCAQNVHGGASSGGILLRKARGVNLDGVTYTGSTDALNLDTTVFPVILNNYYFGSGAFNLGSLALVYNSVTSSANRTGLRIYDASGQTSNIPALTTATFASTTLATTKRQASSGTALSGSNFALSGGWGNTASVGSIGGVDARGSFVVTSAGTGQGANPTITITFADGAWASSPICNVWRMGGSQITVMPYHSTGSTTTATFTFPGTPVAAETYTIGFRCTN